MNEHLENARALFAQLEPYERDIVREAFRQSLEQKSEPLDTAALVETKTTPNEDAKA